MKKSDLEARRQQLNSVSSDTENDFDEIVSSARSPNDTAKITVIPLEKLVEYSDDAFEGITGRPQPFKAHSQESLESLAKSIKENGVIQTYCYCVPYCCSNFHCLWLQYSLLTD